MNELLNPASHVLRRDGACCACGISDRQVLAVHHKIPRELGGRDTLENLTTLCANCHRIVHWLSAGDRSVEAHGYGLGRSPAVRRRLLGLARRIRRRRKKVRRPDGLLTTAVPLAAAVAAVATRNGLPDEERPLFERCLKRAISAMAPSDLKQCSKRLVVGSRFISVNTNNLLAIRAPAWNDYRQRVDADIFLIWPRAVRPSILSAAEFRRAASGRFKLLPTHCNLLLTWDECLDLSRSDWKIFREACHEALSVRTRKWTSNIIV